MSAACKLSIAQIGADIITIGQAIAFTILLVIPSMKGDYPMDSTRNNDRRFIYFYFNRNEPEKIQRIVPVHVQYWKLANLKGYMGGPFGDRAGGLISFIASSFAEATSIIQRDPFVLENLITEKFIKEWIVEEI